MHTGLPSCVQYRNDVLKSDQKSLDSSLPQLMHKLSEACKKFSNDEEKSRLANSSIQAASSPNRKYRVLKFFELLENNKVMSLLIFAFPKTNDSLALDHY